MFSSIQICHKSIIVHLTTLTTITMKQSCFECTVVYLVLRSATLCKTVLRIYLNFTKNLISKVCKYPDI